MNAAAKAINQSSLFDGHLTELRISKQFLLVTVLLCSVLASALAVIYTTNTYRNLLNQTEQAQLQSHKLKMQWGQLLLEQASLATASRVQKLAYSKLGMTYPSVEHTVTLQIR